MDYQTDLDSDKPLPLSNLETVLVLIILSNSLPFQKWDTIYYFE